MLALIECRGTDGQDDQSGQKKKYAGKQQHILTGPAGAADDQKRSFFSHADLPTLGLLCEQCY